MARDETIKLSLIDGVTRTLSQIQQGVSGVGASLTKLNQGAELAAKGFGLIGAAASSIGNAVQGAADIETALTRVADITRATADEQVALQKAVGDAVSLLGVSANDAANALLLMSEDGFSAADAIGSLNTVLAFAKANAQDAATATNALGGVLDTFGEKPEIIAQLADQLTAASRAAGVGTTTLQQGLAAIGVQAEQAGLGVSDAIAALAALASRGIEGTQAAKQLGTVLTELNNPASKAGKALDDAGLAGKSFAGIVDALSKDSAKAAPILEALGNRPRAALKVLLAEGGGALREFGQIVDDATGSSERAAAVVDETFNGAIARLQNSVANLRNEFLSPILQPLAEEAAALAEKINALGDSPQFARIRDQFQELATNAIKAVGDLIEKADLEAWAGDVADFAADAKTAFDGLVVVVKGTADAIRGIGAAIDSVRDAQKKLHEILGENSRPVDAFIARQKALQEQSAKMAASFDSAADKARRFAEAVGIVGKESTSAGNAVAGAGDAAAGAAEDLRRVPEAAKLTIGTLDETGKAAGDAADDLEGVKRAANEAAIAFERLQVSTLSAAIADLARANLQGTDTFRALVAEVGAAEARINKLTEEQGKLAKANQDTADTANNAANSLRNMASAASDAGSAAERTASSNSQVADSFGNIGNQSSEVAISLGYLTEAYVQQALAAAGLAKDEKDYVATLSRFFAAAADQEEKIKARLDQLSRQNAALSEEEQIRSRLALQYGTSSTLLDELVRKELELARAKKQANDETERGIQIEAQRTAGVGVFDPWKVFDQPGANAAGAASASEQARGSTGGRGSGGGGDRSAPQIVINVQGMTTDQARQFVEQSVVPELERINRLSR